jgi:hypothetical protein
MTETVSFLTDGDVEGVKLDSGEPSGANEGVKVVAKRESRAQTKALGETVVSFLCLNDVWIYIFLFGTLHVFLSPIESVLISYYD